VHSSNYLVAPSHSHSPPHPFLQIRKEQFEPIAKIQHARVRRAMQFESIRNHLDRPIHEFGMLARLETQIEVTRIFGIDAKDVDAAFGIGFRVRGQPSVCHEIMLVK